jgi:hypothetical protein
VDRRGIRGGCTGRVCGGAATSAPTTPSASAGAASTFEPHEGRKLAGQPGRGALTGRRYRRGVVVRRSDCCGRSSHCGRSGSYEKNCKLFPTFLDSIFGPPEAAAALRGVFALFTDWGLFGVSSTGSRATGGTDSTSFNNAGLPGIGFQQDPIEYGSLTHHTNLDTYERIIPEDVKQASAEVAAAVWQVANRDQMIPRFTKDAMPAPVVAR